MLRRASFGAASKQMTCCAVSRWPSICADRARISRVASSGRKRSSRRSKKAAALALFIVGMPASASRQRQGDAEQGAMAGLALQGDGAAVRVDQLLGDEQSQSQAAAAVMLHHALEGVEDAFLVLAADADAVVAHFDDGAVLRRRQADFHRLAFARAQGVADQVD